MGQFHHHKPGDKFFRAVKFEFNGGPFVVGFGNQAETITIVLDVLTLRESLHHNLLGRGRLQPRAACYALRRSAFCPSQMR